MSSALVKFGWLLLGFTACYALTWILVYSVVMEGDFRFVVEYFTLGWRGGGEYPTFIQATSLIAASVMSIVGAVLLWRRSLRDGR